MTVRAPLRARLAPWLLGIVATACALAGSWGASPTDDEPTYIGQGAYLVASGDFEAPVLLWQPPLSLYVTSAALPFADLAPGAFDERPASDSLTELGDRLIFESTSPPETILLLSRLPVALVTGLMVAMAAWLAARLGGEAAGWLAGTLVALSPPVFAHGGLATTDAVAAAAALVAISPLIRVPVPGGENTFRLRDAAICGAFLGLALLAKHTALVLVPVTAVGVFLFARQAGAAPGKACGRCLVALAAAALVVWAGFGYEVGLLVPENSAGDLTAKLTPLVPLPASWVEGITTGVPVPAPRYWQSIVFQAAKQHDRLYFRFFDEVAKTGWWSYFPLVTLAKCTAASAVLALGALVTLRWRRPSRSEWILFAAFALPFAAAVVSRHNLGVRHVLPAIPPLLVLVAVRLVRALRSRPAGKLYAAVLVIAGVHAVEGLTALRNPVAWWNVPAGGERHGWRISGQSNADWGQALWALRDVVRRDGLDPVYFTPHGPASAWEHLDEPALRPLEGWWREPLPEEGWLAVSTSALWFGNQVPVTSRPPERFVAGCYRLYRLPLED